MKKIFLMLIAVGLSSCAAGSEGSFSAFDQNKGNGYEIQHTKNSSAYGKISLEYKPYDMLYAAESKKLDDSLADERRRAAKLDNIPKGGWLQVHIERNTIGAAGGEYFEYIILRNGEEIYRRHGRKDIANVPSTPGGMWWNIGLVPVKEPITDKITLYVIDKLQGGRDEFIITKPQKKNESTA